MKNAVVFKTPQTHLDYLAAERAKAKADFEKKSPEQLEKEANEVLQKVAKAAFSDSLKILS
ncbi:MAG: hypothetical protein ACK40T_12300 [Akkermansiaceae bacterium]|jgi:hypothetical protein